MATFATLSLFGFLMPTAASAQLVAAKVDGNSAATYRASRDSFNAFTGGRLDAVTVFGSDQHWTDATGEFIAMDYLLGQIGGLNLPAIIAIPLTPRIEEDTTNYLPEVIAGARNAEFTRAARRLKTWRPSDAHIYLRLGWECNGNWFPWSPLNGRGVTPDQYAAAFRHVATLMSAIEPRIRWVWNGNPGWGPTNADIEAMFPGDVVSVVSLDVYNHVANGSAAGFNAMAGDVGGLNWLLAFAKAHNLDIAIDEWGAYLNGGAWADAMAAWIRAHGTYATANGGTRRLLWHSYWDSGNWKISNGLRGTTGESYRRNFGLPAPGSLQLTSP